MIVGIVVEHMTANSVRNLTMNVLIDDENFSTDFVMRMDHVHWSMSHVLNELRKDVVQDLMLIHLLAML